MLNRIPKPSRSNGDVFDPVRRIEDFFPNKLLFLRMQIPRLSGLRYVFAFLFVAAATGLSLILKPILPDGFLVFYLAAVMLAGWYGRTGAGLFAVVLAMLVVDFLFIAPYRAFVVELDELPYFLTFLLSAVVTSWLGSARRQAEERQRAHLDELFEQTPDAIMLVDLEDQVLRINKEFTRIFGYTKSQIVNRASTDLIVPPQLRVEVLKDRKLLSTGQHVSTETVRHRKGGSPVEVSEVSFPVIVNGQCIAYYVVFRDITRSKKALHDLQAAQGELAHLSRLTTMGELAASIAHEINQPIGAIVTNSDAALRWLRRQPAEVEEAREVLEWIVRDANRAAEVIGRIRSLLAKSPMPMVHLDINEIILEVLLLTNHEIARHGAFVTTELAHPLSPILGDRVRLQQVLLNLIMNSMDAMNAVVDRPRHLHLRSVMNGESIYVHVEDSGRGWDDQHTDSMFDPFFTTKKDGIGMGLAISRSIIEAHGGQLRAARKTPCGATMTFSLPIASKPE
jgi:PAS domain S-box-containing protein